MDKKFNPSSIPLSNKREKIEEIKFKNRYEQFLHESGLSEDDLLNFLNAEWSDEMNADINSRKDSEDVNTLGFGKDEFYQMKKELEEKIREYKNQKPIENNKKEKPNSFIYDLYNGNFKKVDKTLLTPELRVKLRVDNLPSDDFFEIADLGDGRYLPIYYDFTTKNASAYALALVMKKLNIKNWRLPLLTFKRELIGRDVFDPYLPDEIKRLHYEELKVNNIFYFRECYKISGDEEGVLHPYLFNIATLAIMWLCGQSYNSYTELSRPFNYLKYE